MQNFETEIQTVLSNVIENGIFPNLKVEDDIAYTIDPVYGLKRNRINAELSKTLIRINQLNGKDYTTLIQQLLNWLIQNQNSDGSWNEIHVNENSPSALITSIVGEALLDGFVFHFDKKYEKAAHKAKEFVLQNEISTGFFQKSNAYSSDDYLNVDATCGAFLAKYGKVFSDQTCLKVAENVAKHVCENQYPNGAFPYIIGNNSKSTHYLQVPCIHYQGVTIYYLLKINEVLNLHWFDSALKKQIKWLVSVQNSNGKFDWSKSGLMFAYYLSGAYAFAIPCFMYYGKRDDKYTLNAEKALNILKNNISGIANRWESASIWSFPFSTFTVFKTASIGDHPINHKLFRFGYGVYRQFARRRYSQNVNPTLFKFLIKMMKIKTSTIEPQNNFPDLFMTSEMLDCLSYSLYINKQRT